MTAALLQDAKSRSRLSGAAVRALCRSGALTGATTGFAGDRLQLNIAIVPRAYAFDFARYCLANAQACPVIEVAPPGDPRLPGLGEGIDLRTDLPAYQVYRNGRPAERLHHVRDVWDGAFCSFALGCSFSFERALQQAGFAIDHIEAGRNVPMYRTRLLTAAAGPFAGPLVVSMRLLPRARAAEAAAITSDYPYAHGRPVAIDDPGALGLTDLSRPDWGDPPDPAALADPERVPVFWACGVTSQAAIMRAAPPVAVTHAPGAMLVADVKNGPAAMARFRAAQEMLADMAGLAGLGPAEPDAEPHGRGRTLNSRPAGLTL